MWRQPSCVSLLGHVRHPERAPFGRKEPGKGGGGGMLTASVCTQTAG